MNPINIEFQSPAEIKHFQEEKLREALLYLQNHSPFYQRLFKENNVDIQQIKYLEDLQQIPFTAKQDLQVHNEDFLCVPREKIIDFITTSGTLGDPVTFAMTDRDLDRLAYNEKISFACAGVKPTDIVQLMTTIDKRFMAGLAYFLGLRALGAGVIRVGNGIPELQWDTINRIRPNTIMCVPSFILHIIKYAEEHGIDYRNSSVKKVVCIGENLREQDFSLNLLGKRIKEKWDIELYSTYASTEMATTFAECEYGCGGHHHPELVICEVIDSEGNIVPDGEIGELVVTTLGVEGMPLLRFKTGDLVSFHTEKCRCGRHSMRVSPVVGRANHLLKYKGTTLYPPAIYDVLDNTPFVENYVVEVSFDENGNDRVGVRIAIRQIDDRRLDDRQLETPSNNLLSNNLISKNLIKDLKDRFRAKIRVAPEIEICNAEDLKKIIFPDLSRKPVKFIDKRRLDVRQLDNRQLDVRQLDITSENLLSKNLTSKNLNV
ncbi:MAG: AMP-binding protein [Candidatus Symbiothrix sp.]|nr:AMP-binding protein [Candidatus Symbiothrix sp.]